MNKLRAISINTDAPCAKMSECCSAANESFERWLKNDVLYTADNRKFIKVNIDTPSDNDMLRQYKLNIDMKKSYFMDCVTGTLFLENGQCLSSNQINPRKFELAN